MTEKVFNDGLPPIESLGVAWKSIPSESPPLIDGVLRQGHKMMIAGPSKAGKSFSLIELAICIAEGRPWMGFNCVQGKILYVNLELDQASCFNRFKTIYGAMGIAPRWLKNITILNLRGISVPLNMLAPRLIRREKFKGYIAIIIDPIYKILTGSENSAYDMAQFCNLFDQIANECNCAVIYCHHHSKGDQSWKHSADRASGSGVFTRDADAILDMTELELPPDERRKGVTAWRITGTLREFQVFPPVDVWFDYPLHTLEYFDSKAVAPHHELQPYQRAMYSRKSNEQKLLERKRRLEAAYDICAAEGPVTITTLVDYLGVSAQTVRNSVDEHPAFKREKGIITKVHA